MALDYQLITKREALALDPLQYNPRKEEYADLRLAQIGPLEDDDVVAVAAFDGPCIVGKILLRYGLVPFDGSSIRLACAQDLVVAESYRGRGIGRVILEQSTAIRVPQIHSGLSAMSAPLIEKLNFASIDKTPAYQMPVSRKGLLRRLRADVYAADLGLLGPARGLARSLADQAARQARQMRHRGGAAALNASEAIGTLDVVLSTRVRRFQIPWNRDKLIRALQGKDADSLAWVLVDLSDGAARHHLVTAYRYEKEVRLPVTNRIAALCEWRVNEVYPPLHDRDGARAIVAATVENLARQGADIVEFFASTPEIVCACAALGMVASIEKSMYLVPSGVDAGLADALTTPAHWWCRALNEEQYEESQPHLDIIVAPRDGAHGCPAP